MLCVETIDVFYGDAQALDGVSLEIEEGAIVAIVGANGAGKTSLIRTIAGMHRPVRGSITFRDVEIGGWESHRVCNLGIGQVAEGRQVFPTLSVAENLEIGAMLPRAPTSLRTGGSLSPGRASSSWPTIGCGRPISECEAGRLRSDARATPAPPPARPAGFQDRPYATL